MSRSRAWVLAVGFVGAMAGCRSGLGFAVALDLNFDANVSDEALASITQLSFSTKGDESYDDVVALMRSALRHERIVYRPKPTTTLLTISVTAEDANGDAIATGMTSPLMLTPGVTTDVAMTLSAVDMNDAGLSTDAHDAFQGDAGDKQDLSSVDIPPPASLCPIFSGLACESFEQPIATPWTNFDNNGGTLVEAAGEVYRGDRAGHATTPPIAANESATGQLIYNNVPTTGSVYMRGFFYIDAPPAAAYIALLRLEQPSTPFNAIGVNVMTDGTLGTESDFAGKDGTGTVPFPMGRWVCVELAIELGASGMLHVSVDGVQQSALDISGTTVGSPAPTQFVTGLYYQGGASALPAYDYWLDEIAVDIVPIGCDR